MRPEPLPTRREVVIAGHAGDVDTVRAGLSSPDPAVRASALGALVRQGHDATTEVTAGGDDADTTVRQRVARLLPIATMGSDARARVLERLLADPDPMVIEVAAAAAGEITPASPTVVARLVELATGHAEHLCRESAVAALGSLGAPEGRAAVLAACSDRATVRRRAVLALAAYDGPEVDEMLERMCGDRDVQVRQAAEDMVAIARGMVPGET